MDGNPERFAGMEGAVMRSDEVRTNLKDINGGLWDNPPLAMTDMRVPTLMTRGIAICLFYPCQFGLPEDAAATNPTTP